MHTPPGPALRDAHHGHWRLPVPQVPAAGARTTARGLGARLGGARRAGGTEASGGTRHSRCRRPGPCLGGAATETPGDPRGDPSKKLQALVSLTLHPTLRRLPSLCLGLLTGGTPWVPRPAMLGQVGCMRVAAPTCQEQACTPLLCSEPRAHGWGRLVLCA